MEDLRFQVSIAKDADSDGNWVSYILKSGEFEGYLFSLLHPFAKNGDEVEFKYFYAKLDRNGGKVETLEPTKESDEMALHLSIYTEENFDNLLYDFQKIIYNV